VEFLLVFETLGETPKQWEFLLVCICSLKDISTHTQYSCLLSDVSREGTGAHCQEYIGSRLGKHLPLKRVSCTRQEPFPIRYE
jgi:hypothetical protein